MRKPLVWITASVAAVLVAGAAIAWFFLGQTGSSPPRLARGSAPSFVTGHQPQDIAKAKFDPVDGVQILLLDLQYDATASRPAQYQRIVKHAASAVGVADAARVILPFDPYYQKVILNHAYVVRDGKKEDRATRVSATFASVEPAADANIFTGRMTATLQIEDVRAGDTVDIAITIAGANPTLEGHHTEVFALSGAVGIERLSVRSVWPEDAVWKLEGGKVDIKGRKTGGKLAIEFGPAAVDPVIFDFMSSVFPEITTLTVSTFRDWKSVVAWGEPMYRFAPDKSVKDVAAKIKAENATEGEQIMAALRFVQSDIRYLAYALGSGGYTPQSPAETLRLRYGDCKAKSALFVALLAELGVDAAPAMVNSFNGAYLANALSTPAMFDHVIVKVSWNGRVLWLDPTLVQGGDINRVAQADYGYALPLQKSASRLEKMEPPRVQGLTHEMASTYDVTGGPSAPAVLAMTATFRGAGADSMRQIMEAMGGPEKMMTEGLKAQYQKSELVTPVQTSDDLAANVLRISLGIRIDQPFMSGGPMPAMPVYSGSLTPVVFPAVRKDQTHDIPVAAVDMRETIRVKLPSGPRWELPSETQVTENRAFRFSRTTDLTDDEYVIAFEMKSLVRAIPVSEFDKVSRDQTLAMEMSRFVFWMDVPAKAALPPLQFAGAPAEH